MGAFRRRRLSRYERRKQTHAGVHSDDFGRWQRPQFGREDTRQDPEKTLRLTPEELHLVNTRKGLIELLSSKHVNIDKALVKLRYERELERLQIEFVKLQRAVQLSGRR